MPFDCLFSLLFFSGATTEEWTELESWGDNGGFDDTTTHIQGFSQHLGGREIVVREWRCGRGREAFWSVSMSVCDSPRRVEHSLRVLDRVSRVLEADDRR